MIIFEEIETGNRYSLNDFGLIMQPGHSHPIPTTRDKTIAIPGKPGAWDFGAMSDIRQFKFPLTLLEIDNTELQSKLNTFITFLYDYYGKPKTFKLFFEYELDKYYYVRYSGQISPDRLIGIGTFDLPLTAFKPYKNFILPSDKITMDSDIPILSDISMDTGLSNQDIRNSQTFEVINNGALVIPFAFILEGTGDNVSLTTNGKTMTLGSFSNKTIEVTDNYVVKVDGVSDLTSTNGVFLELLPGVNNISINGSNLNLTISESLTYQYI